MMEKKRDEGTIFKISLCSLIFLFLSSVFFAMPAASSFAQDAPGKFATKKGADQAQKEETLKKEEERLNALRKEVEEKIDKYNKLLSQIEEAIKVLETAKAERMEHLVKTYESMAVEDAAARLSALDEPTAVKIILRMKSKRAGLVMAAMDPKKAAAITESIMSAVKKFPTK